METGREKRASITDLILIGLAGVTVAVAVASYFRPTPTIQQPPGGPVEADVLGRQLTPLRVTGTGGEATLYDLTETRRPTLLLAFRSTCPYCEATAPIWRNMVSQLGDDIRVVAVGMEALPIPEQWLAHQNLAVTDLVIPANLMDLSEWFITAVPTTIVVDHDGRVLAFRKGLLADSDMATLMGSLGGD